MAELSTAAPIFQTFRNILCTFNNTPPEKFRQKGDSAASHTKTPPPLARKRRRKPKTAAYPHQNSTQPFRPRTQKFVNSHSRPYLPHGSRPDEPNSRPYLPHDNRRSLTVNQTLSPPQPPLTQERTSSRATASEPNGSPNLEVELTRPENLPCRSPQHTNKCGRHAHSSAPPSPKSRHGTSLPLPRRAAQERSPIHPTFSLAETQRNHHRASLTFRKKTPLSLSATFSSLAARPNRRSPPSSQPSRRRQVAVGTPTSRRAATPNDFAPSKRSFGICRGLSGFRLTFLPNLW